MKLGPALATALFAASAILVSVEAAEARGAYTVKHTVEATAEDAVKAKAEAMAKGKQEAAHILFKRLVPMRAYGSVPTLSRGEAERIVESVAVRGEQNSTTKYIATLSFEFQPSAIRQALEMRGLPVFDRQAPVTKVMPVVIADGAVKQASSEGWADAWNAADLTGSLAPLMLVQPDDSLKPEGLENILGGDKAAFDALKKQAGAERLVLAVGSQLEDGRFATRLYGDDAVGPIELSRTDRIFNGDVRDAAARAALVAQRVIETRWKITHGNSMPESMPWAEGGQGGESDVAAYGNDGASPYGGEGAPYGEDPAAYGGDPAQQYAAPQPAQPKQEESGGIGSFFGGLFGFGESEEEAPPAPPQFSTGRVNMTVQFDGLEQWQGIRSELVVVPGLEALEVGTLTARTAEVAFNYAGDVNRLRSDLAARGLALSSSGPGSYVLVQN